MFSQYPSLADFGVSVAQRGGWLGTWVGARAGTTFSEDSEGSWAPHSAWGVPKPCADEVDLAGRGGFPQEAGSWPQPVAGCPCSTATGRAGSAHRAGPAEPQPGWAKPRPRRLALALWGGGGWWRAPAVLCTSAKASCPKQKVACEPARPTLKESTQAGTHLGGAGSSDSKAVTPAARGWAVRAGTGLTPREIPGVALTSRSVIYWWSIFVSVQSKRLGSSRCMWVSSSLESSVRLSSFPELSQPHCWNKWAVT